MAVQVAVLGGGLMGCGIAQTFASAGAPVRLYEPSDDVRCGIPERIRDGLLAMGGPVDAAELVSVTGDLAAAVDGACFVTESAPEKLPVKRELFAALSTLAPEDAILASNTSVIPISSIGREMAAAERIVGTHWWNPPPLIPLVEVVPGELTAPETVAAAMEMMKRIGKTPAHVRKDVPGFIGNRLQFALWREAIAMVADGVCDAETLDMCVKSSFGRRLAVLGPLENADLIGLDLTLDIHRTIIPELDRHAAPHPYLESLVSKGMLGFKTGEGFRQWREAEIKEARTRLIDHLLSTGDGRSEAVPSLG